MTDPLPAHVTDVPAAGDLVAQMTGRTAGSVLRSALGGPPPLARPHSERLTADTCGSERCDPVERTSSSGAFLLHLRQEGRGIGLYFELDAHAQQDAGLDTDEAADVALGRGEDERDDTAAAQMLPAIGVQRIALLSNLTAKRDHTAHTLDLPLAG